jgi:anti-sigma factor RsiW
MSCSFQRDEFQEYLDQALDPDRARALSEHLESCPKCRAAFDGLRALDDTLRGLSPDAFPPGLHERIIASVSPARSWRLRLGAAASVLLAASVLFALAFGSGAGGEVLADVRDRAEEVVGSRWTDLLKPEAVSQGMETLGSSVVDGFQQVLRQNPLGDGALPLSGGLLVAVLVLSFTLAFGLNLWAVRKMRAAKYRWHRF